MLIQVTQEDIDNGIIGSGHSCPIALAVKRATGYGYVSVSVQGVVYGEHPDGKVFSIEADENIEKFVLYFDEEIPVEPFSFEIPVP